MASVKCYLVSDLKGKAKQMPLAFMADYEANRLLEHSNEFKWCYEAEVFVILEKRYAGYTASVASPFERRISGCCDRADQY